MATITARISSKNQIVLPREVRQVLRVEPGDSLVFVVRNGGVVVLPRPRNFTAAMRGLHRELWAGLDASEWLREERAEWQ
ncbi:MAG: AbrB/MazE/SpoVT family DNA-binding domain-containing protein [Chloroflexi bacterium]|nr:AbrB/MazE/SpoVT family DNA-binding domain-containing protein [Chloroflexota bacterium]